MLVFHQVFPEHRERFEQLIRWCKQTFEMAGPEDADKLVDGKFEPGQRDKLLITLDDGFSNNYDVGRWLAERGIRATFFVIPSYLDCSTDEFLAYHTANGVEAYPMGIRARHQPCRGMARDEVLRLRDLGHRIAAHNYAHRDLGGLRDADDLAYEIDRSLDEVSELLGQPCHDFAIGFGGTQHVSPEALDVLRHRRSRVYFGVRGLNVPCVTPPLLLRDMISPSWPLAFSQQAALGALDDRATAGRARLAVWSGALPGQSIG
jgi:peptidoglycan/xylan/chitin deacetylase (PgdA/CDA1 family)